MPNEPQWQQDKKKTDAFGLILKHIIAENLIVEGNVIQDQSENTDYLFVVPGRCRIASRLRLDLLSYFNVDAGALWGDQFTIRSGRPSGAHTELQKIIAEEKGDIFLYAWGTQEPEMAVPAYVFIDLRIFRQWYNGQLYDIYAYPTLSQGRPWTEHTNPLDRTQFLSIKLTDLPPKAILARQQLPMSMRQELIAFRKGYSYVR